MLSKRLLGIVLACALLLCGCMTGEGPVENKPVLDTPDARAAFTREAMMFTEMLFAGLPCEGTVTENGVQYPVVAHEQYPTYQSLVDALNWYFDPALAGALKEAMPYAEVQGKPVKTRDTATAGAQFDKSTVTADSAEGLTLTVPSSQGDLTVSITLKDGRISGYTGAGHPTDTTASAAYERFCLNAVYATYSYCLPLWEATLPLDRSMPDFYAVVPSDMYKDHATVRQTLLGWCNETVTDKLLAESPYTVQNGVWGLSAVDPAGGDLPDTITAVWQGGKVIATLTDGTQTTRFAVTFTGTLITAVEPYDGDVLTEAEALAIAVNTIKRANVARMTYAIPQEDGSEDPEYPSIPAGTSITMDGRTIVLELNFHYACGFYTDGYRTMPTPEDIALGFDAGYPIRTLADFRAFAACAYTENGMKADLPGIAPGTDYPKFIEVDGRLYSNGGFNTSPGLDETTVRVVSVQADRITVYVQNTAPMHTWEEATILRVNGKWLLNSHDDLKEPPASISGTYDGKKVTLSVDVVTDLLYDKNETERLWFGGVGFYNGYALLMYHGTAGGEIFDSARYNAIDYSGRPVLKDGATIMSVFGEDGRTMAGFTDSAWDMVWINGQGEVLGEVEPTNQYVNPYVIYSELHYTAPLPQELSDYFSADQLSPTTKRVPEYSSYDNSFLWYYLCDNDGNKLYDRPLTYIGPFENGVAPILDYYGQLGLIAEDGTVLVPPTYELDQLPFDDELGEVFLCDGRIVAAYNGRYTIFKVTVEGTTAPETQPDLMTEAQAKVVCETLLRDAYDLLHFLHCDMYTDETDSFEVEVEYILHGETHKRTMGYSLITTYEQRGIYTLDDVRIALEKIYTPEAAIETGLFAQPSYSNEVDIKERDGKLYYVNATKGWFGSYVPDSLQILSVTKDTVEMKISVIGGPQPEILGDFTYTLKNTENGWRLDTHYTDGWIWPAEN